MNEGNGSRQQLVGPPNEVMQQLLNQHAVTKSPPSEEALMAQRVTILERQAPELVQAAKEVGVEIDFLGIAALPPGPMYYTGAGGIGWVMGPATTPDDAVIPKREAKDLRHLKGSGIFIPRIYIAHEVPEERSARIREQVSGSGLELDTAEAAELVGPIPPPAEAVALGERMAHRSRQVVTGLRRTGKLVVGAVTIPVMVAGAVLAQGVDPIVLGAIPAASEKPGAPASWYRLVSWDW